MQSEIQLPKYWIWEDGLSHELCNMAIADLEKSNKMTGKIHGSEEETVDLNIRDSKIFFPELNYWLEGILFNYATYANINANWNYSVDKAEGVQLTEYGQKGHYDWHEDWNPFDGKPLIRKLSVVCLLTDPSEFEGGDFEFKSHNGGVVPLKKGSVVVFPSFLSHRVAPVISGKRISAVTWILGKNTL
jgi:PKHD-type hydroxylase